MGHISDSVTLDNPVFIHESAWLYGKVYVGPDVSIWPNVVTRAEFHEIKIGARTNIQDFVMIHVGAMTPTVIGEDCSIRGPRDFASKYCKNRCRPRQLWFLEAHYLSIVGR